MPTDPNDDLVSFLQSNVNGGNISVSFTPSDDIGHANYEGANSYPQIAVVTNDPVIPGGGQTGYTSISSDGSGPNQATIATILVDCWGGPEDDDTYQRGSDHPADIAAELAEEVRRACHASATNPPSGYDWLGARRRGDAHDTDRNPTHYREQVECLLRYVS